MKKSVYVVVSILLLLAAMFGYHRLSPKVELLNNTGLTFDELIVQLPLNRISVGPVLAGNEYRVYYSLQQQQGAATYVLKSNGQPLVSGEFPYHEHHEIGRTLRFEILNRSGVISVDISTQ